MFMSTSSSASAYFRLFMSTFSSCQPVSKVDMLLKVHIYVLVNLKFSISFISAYSCQPQVHVNVRLMLRCICICTPHMHVHTKLACNENSCQTLLQTQNSQLRPQKVKKGPKIKSNSRVRIERNIENESCSTI